MGGLSTLVVVVQLAPLKKHWQLYTFISHQFDILMKVLVLCSFSFFMYEQPL